MAIKYFHIPEQKKTVAVLEGCRYDAINKIYKIVSQTKGLSFDPNKYLLKNVYRAVVVCNPGDTYNKQDGEKFAKEKLLDHYYEHLDKMLDTFAEDLNDAMYQTSVMFDNQKNHKYHLTN